MTNTTTVSPLVERFDLLSETLNSELVERRHEIRVAMLSLVGGVHVYLLGPPGVAKSLLVDRLTDYVSGASVFKILMSRFTQPEEVFGPTSLRGLRDDRFERKLDGYMADAQLAFLDEGFKASSSILNALLWAINERQYRHGDKVIDIPLSSMFLASNELPQDESLGALYDRLLFRMVVSPVKDQSSFVRMLQLERVAHPAPILSWDEVLQAKVEASQVIIPPAVYEALAELKRALKGEGIEPTERRFVESLKVIRAAAWLDGEAEADVEHLRSLQHIMWTQPEQRATVDKLVLGLSNPLDSEANVLLKNVEDLVATIDAIKEDDDRIRRGTELHGKLRRAKGELDNIQRRAGNSRRRSETVAECRDLLANATRRVLTEVFRNKPPAGTEEVDPA